MMILISLGAFLGYLLVAIRCIAFAIETKDRHQSDNAEVGYILGA